MEEWNVEIPYLEDERVEEVIYCDESLTKFRDGIALSSRQVNNVIRNTVARKMETCEKIGRLPEMHDFEVLAIQMVDMYP